MQPKPVIYNGDDTETELPCRWDICGGCQGHGTDRGASVECDGGGFTSSEWAEQDDDFREGYLRGDYDRPCATCGGSGKVSVPDYARMSPEQIKAWEAQCADDAATYRIERMERMMGA